MKRRLVLTLLAFLLTGCGLVRELAGPSEPGVINVSADDAEMNAAIQEAQGTLDTFIASLQSPQPGQTGFSIKARFAFGDDGGYEHIWIADVSYDGKAFSGTIANEPVDVKNLEFGQRVTIPVSEVTDWMLVQDGKLVGGYTLRVLLKRMSPEEREQTLEDAGFTVDD